MSAPPEKKDGDAFDFINVCMKNRVKYFAYVKRKIGEGEGERIATMPHTVQMDGSIYSFDDSPTV